MHYYKVLLIGASGKGKTYSFKNLAQAGNKTLFINVENKPLPFKGKFAHEVVPTTPLECRNFIQKGSISTNFDIILFDSFSAYADLLLADSRKAKKGYDIWNYYNENIGNLNEVIKNTQKEVFVTAHYEIVGDEITGVRERRAKVKGKEWEGQIEKDYTIVLYAEAIPIIGSKPKRVFTLVTDGTNSAKTPPEIFGEDILQIENDSKLVFDKIKEFRSEKIS